MQPARWQLYVISFVEGASLMAVELIGAKLVTPFFGNSIYVWASALGFTLLGLMSGYFLGGWLSYRHPQRRLLYGVVLASGLLVALMPLTATGIVGLTSGLGLKTAVMLSEFTLLVPPVLLFGIVSPMIIRLITAHVAEVGTSAGRIYTLSTVGGILFNFLMGLYLIPFLGVKASAWITASLLCCSAGVFLISIKSTSSTR
jgi:predicted membrane-bound spermidine synthase